MDTRQKLELLADASRYDLSCSCGTQENEHRRRGAGGVWLYPVSLPSGGESIMLKTLLSNSCTNDCRYCPFRATQDVRRCTLNPEEVAGLFLELSRRLNLHGLFLSSGVIRDPDHTMDRMTAVAEILRRRHRYGGYIHLKVIPGASDAAIERALSLSNAVSLNIEVPTRSAFTQLSTTKDFDRDIVRPLRRISELTRDQFTRVKQTTQFIVGAADESDREIVTASFRLYRRMGLDRVYFSAYQRGLGDASLPGEHVAPGRRPEDLLSREHRLYQCDWLLRKYGFTDEEIPFETDGNLSLECDPKELWARRHPEFFPVDVNRADREELLRVPGLGLLTVRRILESRSGGRLRSIRDIGTPGKRLRRAEPYIQFGQGGPYKASTRNFAKQSQFKPRRTGCFL